MLEHLPSATACINTCNYRTILQGLRKYSLHQYPEVRSSVQLSWSFASGFQEAVATVINRATVSSEYPLRQDLLPSFRKCWHYYLPSAPHWRLQSSIWCCFLDSLEVWLFPTKQFISLSRWEEGVCFSRWRWAPLAHTSMCSACIDNHTHLPLLLCSRGHKASHGFTPLKQLHKAQVLSELGEVPPVQMPSTYLINCLYEG